MDNNFLWAFPPRYGIAREFLIIGDGRQLYTIVRAFEPGADKHILFLPELENEPKVLLEYTIQVPPNHIWHSWPETIGLGFTPLIGRHGRTYKSWFSSRGLTIPDNHDLFCRQIAIAPVQSTKEVLQTAYTMVVDATELILKAEQNKAHTQQLMDNL